MIDPKHVESLLKFLGVQHKYWQVAVERSVLASVRALHFLHTVRFGGRSEATLTAFDPGNSDSEHDDSVEDAVLKRRVRGHHVRTAHDGADADPSTCYETEPKQPRLVLSKQHKTLPAREVTGADEYGAPYTSASGPERAHRASATHSLPVSTHGAARNKDSLKRPSKKRGKGARPTTRMMYTVGLHSSGRASTVARRPLPKRKRWETTAMGNALDAGEGNQRPAKQRRRTMDDQPEALWKRWRQLEPRRERRT